MESKYTKEPMDYVTLLGHKVKDKITGYEGTVTHVGFDLYGCIQAIVNKPGEDKDGELFKGTWFDVNRLDVLSSEPVMECPVFGGGADQYKPTK